MKNGLAHMLVHVTRDCSNNYTFKITQKDTAKAVLDKMKNRISCQNPGVKT